MHTALLLLVASIAYIASAMPMDNTIGAKSYSRFLDFPDGDGNLHNVDLEAEPDFELLETLTRNPANNQYFLFTRRNQITPQPLIINDADSIRKSNYNGKLETVIVVHGWLSDQDSGLNPTIAYAYLRKKDVNLIVMDWRRLARADYATAVRGVPAVGRGLGQFINFLINTAGGNLNNFHLIGFSLGAHLVGNAGRELGGRVARITGLDPAGPLWNINRDRLSRNDGVYVEAIHTDGGNIGLGIGSAVADADFFPNGGNSQPGCLTNSCNHSRAWELFAATVTYNHLVAQLCQNNLQLNWDNCRGSNLHMGNAELKKSGNGLYRVNTGRRYPF